MNIIEELEHINETKRLMSGAPATLMLQLKSVQPFPNGQKVALYFSPALKQYFSFVYGKNGIISEEFSFIEKLKQIEEVESVIFNDGSSLNINKECAERILNIYESLEENKYDFEEYIIDSETNFLNALEYSVNKQKKED